MSTTDEATTRLRATLDRVRHYSARVTLPKGTATVAADDLRTVLDALAAEQSRGDDLMRCAMALLESDDLCEASDCLSERAADRLAVRVKMLEDAVARSAIGPGTRIDRVEAGDG